MVLIIIWPMVFGPWASPKYNAFSSVHKYKVTYGVNIKKCFIYFPYL